MGRPEGEFKPLPLHGPLTAARSRDEKRWKLTGETCSMKFTVPDMTCGHCASAVTKAIKAMDPQAEIKVDVAAKTVTVETATPAATVSAALAKAGYPASAA
jgi:copper chaperone